MRRDALEAEVRYDNEVSAEDAAEAATQRAARTQQALILVEAQVLTWKRRYVQAVKAAEDWEREALRLRGGDDGEDQGGTAGPDPECAAG